MLYQVWLFFLFANASCFITGRAHGVGVGNLAYLPTLFSFLIQYGNNYTVCIQPNKSFSKYVVKHMVGPLVCPRLLLPCMCSVRANHLTRLPTDSLLPRLGWRESFQPLVVPRPSFSRLTLSHYDPYLTCTFNNLGGEVLGPITGTS